MVENSGDSRLRVREQVMSLRTYAQQGTEKRLLSVVTVNCFSVRKRDERWCSTDWKLNLRPRMLQKSRVNVLAEVSRHPRSSAEEQSNLGIFVVPSPDGDCGEAILKF